MDAQLRVGQAQGPHDGAPTVVEPFGVPPDVGEEAQVQAGVLAVPAELLAVGVVGLVEELPGDVVAAGADLHDGGDRGGLEPADEGLFVGGSVPVAAGVRAVEGEARGAQAERGGERGRPTAT
jgi:hypothetical protein